MNTKTITLALFTTALLSGVAGCSGDGGSTGPTTITTTAPTSTVAAPSPTTPSESPSVTTTTSMVTATQTPGTSVDKPDPTPPATQPLGNPDMERKIRYPEGAYDLSVTNVRMAEHDTFTRVVFDFSGTGMPGWWTNYSAQPAQQASGLPVEVAGDSFLEISLDGIALPPDAAVPGVEFGSFGGAGIVNEVVLTTIFEARAQFFIGMSGPPRNYSVTLLQEPTRVVVDLMH